MSNENNNNNELVKSSSSRINRLDLQKNPKYKDVTAWTTITDSEFLDSVQGIKAYSTQIDKNSIIIAEINNEFKILAKEFGTDKIIDLTQDSKQINNSAEQVNRLDGNKESEEGRAYTFVNPIFDNQEIAIRKTGTGQIKVEKIENIDNNGNRETIPIQTDVTHPTKEESERAKYEKYGYTFKDDDGDAVMTLDEVEKTIDEMVLEKTKDLRDADEMNSIRDEVMEYVQTSKENPTYKELDNIVNSYVEDHEKNEPEEKLDEEEKEKEDDEEWLYGMSSRRHQH